MRTSGLRDLKQPVPAARPYPVLYDTAPADSKARPVGAPIQILIGAALPLTRQVAAARPRDGSVAIRVKEIQLLVEAGIVIHDGGTTARADSHVGSPISRRPFASSESMPTTPKLLTPRLPGPGTHRDQ